MTRPNSRLKQFELHLADDRRRQARRPRAEADAYSFEAARRQRPRNTLGPQEDVIERRRHRNHVAVSATQASSSRNILVENVIFLLLLAASIYGIYRLCIYILNL